MEREEDGLEHAAARVPRQRRGRDDVYLGLVLLVGLVLDEVDGDEEVGLELRSRDDLGLVHVGRTGRTAPRTGATSPCQ